MRIIQSILIMLLSISSTAFAESIYNLTPGVSPISRDVYQLHMTIFWICVVIGAGVFGVMFYAMFHHRKSKGAKAAHFHTHPVLEIAWTIIPALILVVMAIPATNVLMRMNNYDQEDITIKITGYQWKWQYEYMEDGVKFFSNLATPFDQIHNKAPKSEHYLLEVDHPIVVPIHKKIRFLITSNDVNHAWWVPALAVKRDAISGLINEAWAVIDKPGTYRGQCAELCGVNHAFMPIVIIATTEQGYKDWVAKQKGQSSSGDADTTRVWTMDELMKSGEKTYNTVCAACHQPGGVGMPPTFPAIKGGKVSLGPISQHVNVVVNGVAGTAMQAFKNQLSDVEIAGVVTYERNAFGNNTNTMVQPIQIKSIRDGKSIEDALKVQPSANAGADAPATTGGEGQATTPTQPATKAGKDVKPAAKSAATDAVSTTKAGATSPTETVPATATTAAAPTTAVSATAAAVKPAASANGAKVEAGATPAIVEDLKTVMERGEKVYLQTCAACHQPSGEGMPPTFPALKADPVATGPVALHIDRVLNGKPGTAMMAFKDQLTDQELADVITYERNSWGNNDPKIVAAEDIKTARSLPPKE